MANDEWRVLPHGSIERLSENLWWVQGSLRGLTLKRAMTVARLADGRLAIYSAIALEPAAMQALEAWGTPAFLIVPNAYHRIDAAAYKRRYPQLRVLAPPGSRAKVQSLVPVDGGLDAFPPDPGVQLESLRGTRDAEAAMLVRSDDGSSVILSDSVFNMDRKRDLLGFLFTTLLGSAPGPRISRLSKLVLIKDKAKFRAELTRYAQLTDLRRLIVAHEKIAHGPDARAALEQALTFL
jgi:hypothetical protein